ncbi:MAG: CDP-diacylglycerol--glycerol-3-phosphate 3-phosphatidyltransferase [Clostridia bacterium]|nr:CDP-diacylglycerol--glycerol-3-phosphate 3-phosphatidyltransferase [Clostridia bacterium]
MNTPNKLTLARMIVTPIFMAIMLIEALPYRFLISAVIFAAASLTDMIDGKMARKYNLVTDFGKFLDPLADKMLTTSAYLGFVFVFKDTAYCWHMIAILFILLFREFMVSSLRLVTVSASSKVVAANIWGKLKTVSQMVGIVVALLAYTVIGDFGVTSIAEIANIVIIVLFWISALLCVISGFIYLMGSKEYIDPTK